MLKSLKIEKYQGVNCLEVPQLTRINVLVGNDFSAKRAVLDYTRQALMGCCVLADNFGSDIHYTEMSDRVKALLSQSYSDNFQAVITVNSYEVLQTFYEAIKELEFNEDDFSLIRLSIDINGTKVTIMPGKLFNVAIEHNMEVR